MIPSPLTRIAVICGPTGSGKTGFAVDLAMQLNAEIVGADSMQIFRYMDIGTAKPTPDEQAAAPHHLIDVAAPDDPFDAARYVKSADKAIANIIERGKVPLIVGGTGLYIKALTHGLFQTSPTDPTIRAELKKKAEILGNGYLHQHLSVIDPAAAQKININDTQRLLRAIEVFETTGTRISSAQKKHSFARPRYQCLKIGLQMERAILYERIDQRVDAMLDEGILDEVKKLLSMGYHPEIKSMQALGYRHMVGFIQNKISWQEAVRTLKRDHRRYAKRQMTWFGADREVHWLSPDQKRAGLKMIMEFFQSENNTI